MCHEPFHPFLLVASTLATRLPNEGPVALRPRLAAGLPFSGWWDLDTL